MSYITNKAGITLDGGFKLDSAQPLDVRFVIASGENKDDLLASSCYAGMEVWDSNDNKKYRAVPKTGGGFEWKEVGTMEDIPDITFPDITVTDTGTKPIVGDITASGHTITVSRIGLDDLGLATAYKYKGSVAAYANLPTTGNTEGDVYNVTDTGMNYAWTGTAWDALGSIIDTSNFVSATKNASVNVAGTTKDTYRYDKTAIFAPNGLIMGGTAAAAGLVTRGICGVSTPDATTGAATKDNLYINYDSNNNWNPNGRGLIINAGTAGTDLGNGMYQYAAVRGDIVKAWVEAKGYVTSQGIKTLKTDNTTAQTASASEDIAGSGTINLHKVSKTGSYNDLLNKPTILNPTDYYWANVKVSTTSNDSTVPTFSPTFKYKITAHEKLNPAADWALSTPIAKYLWHDLIAFKTATFEQSTDGTTWTTSTNSQYTQSPTNQKENQTIEVVNSTNKYARWTWTGGWHACQAQWLVIGFTYQAAAANCKIILESYNTPNTSTTPRQWVTVLNTTATGNSSPVWFKLDPVWTNCDRIRLTIQWNSSATHDSKNNEYKCSISSVKFLTARWGNQGFGSELEKPYSWDNNASLYYRNSSSTLGLSSAPWSAIYGTTIYEGGTSLADKYLGITAKAADSDKLDGQDGTYYLDYNNFTNTPTIPTVYNKTITLTAGNGLTTGGSFTLNQSTDKEITFNVGAGNGISVTADAVAAKAGNGITVDSTGIHHADTSTLEGAYGPSVGGTQTSKKTMDIVVPQITVDGYGHVTAVNNQTFTVTDTDTNTDTKVTQSSTTTDSWRKVVLGKQSGTMGAAVTATTDQVYVTPNVEVQPSTGSLRTAGNMLLHNPLGGDSPKLVFQRGDEKGNVTDWNMYVQSGVLKINSIPTSDSTTEKNIVDFGYHGGMTVYSSSDTANVETASMTVKTSNGGQLIIGKEGPNSGTMLRFDQTAGTTRLRFRSSATQGAMVWEQPEKAARLYFDFGNAAGTGVNRVNVPNPEGGGTLALTSDIKAGTVTSVGMTVPTGLSVSPATITSSGTFAITYASGYAIPTTTKQSNWDTAYEWGDHAAAGYLTEHQSIKTLNTNNSTAQTVSASEAIAGSGTINLHKIAKTGSASDLTSGTIPDARLPYRLKEYSGGSSVAKADDATKQGFYYVTSGDSKKPPFKQIETGTSSDIGSDYHVFTTAAYSADWVHQLGFDCRSNDLFVRRKHNKIWQPWTSIVKFQPCTGDNGNTIGTITDNAIPRWDTTRNTTLQNSGVTIDDNNNVTTPGTMEAATIKKTGGADTHVLLAGGGTKAIDDITGTTYGADRGISLSNGKFGHSNTAVTAVTTAGLYKIKYDAYGHITGTESFTLPTVNNGILTIQKNGTDIATFTANQSGNTTANIEVPDPANYYWADVKVSSTSNTATAPTVQKIGITGSTTTNATAAVTMEYDSSYKALKFKFA